MRDRFFFPIRSLLWFDVSRFVNVFFFLRYNCKVLAELKTYNLIASLDVPFLLVRYNQHPIIVRGIVAICCILFLKLILFLILRSNERLLVFDVFKDRDPVVQRKIELASPIIDIFRFSFICYDNVWLTSNCSVTHLIAVTSKSYINSYSRVSVRRFWISRVQDLISTSFHAK